MQRKKNKLDREKKEEIESVLNNTEKLKEDDVKLIVLLQKTQSLRENLSKQYTQALEYYRQDFLSIPEKGQLLLGTVVNNAKAIAVSLNKGI